MDNQVLELLIDGCLVEANEPINQLFVAEEESYQLLDSAWLVLAEHILEHLALLIF